MNKRLEPDSSPGDKDIGALFKAQRVSAPDDLDELILSEARQAVATEQTAAATSSWYRVRPWLAAASVAIIAIGIAPQLLKSPESALEPGKLRKTYAEPVMQAESSPAMVSSEETLDMADEQMTEVTSDDAVTVIDPAPMPAPVQAPVQAPVNEQPVAIAGGAAGDVAQQKSQKISRDTVESVSVENNPSTGTEEASTARLIPIQLNSERSSFAMTTEKAARQPSVYRRNPETWMAEIRRLEADDMIAAAHYEYGRFRAQYPDYKTDFKPSLELQERD